MKSFLYPYKRGWKWGGDVGEGGMPCNECGCVWRWGGSPFLDIVR